MITITDTILLVRHAFGGLKDSQGVPMAEHCIRVADPFEAGTLPWHTAMLHDIIEDTKVDEGYLREMGYPEEVISSVLLLTHDKKQMSYPDYIDRICQSGDATAIAVKISDQRDNLNPKRWVGLGKYRANALQKKWAGVLPKLEDALQRAA